MSRILNVSPSIGSSSGGGVFVVSSDGGRVTVSMSASIGSSDVLPEIATVSVSSTKPTIKYAIMPKINAAITNVIAKFLSAESIFRKLL